MSESQHSDLHAGDYHLLGADLRQSRELWEKLKLASLDPAAPVVVLAECVLVYMDTHVGDALARSFADAYGDVAFISYEQVSPATPCTRWFRST